MPDPIAPVVAPAPAADAPVIRKAPPRASDYLAEAAKEAGGEGTGGVRQDPDPMAQSPKPAPKPEDAELETRITKLAGERRQVDTDRAALKAEREKFAAEQAESLTHAGNWKKLQEARTKGEVLAALKTIGWTQEQIDTDVYTTLSKDILAREPGEPLTHKDVQDLIDERVKAEREAAAKTAETEQAARQTKAWDDYHAGVDASFDPAKYPALAKRPVTRNEVQTFVNEKFDGGKGEIPSPEEIHQHFDKHRREEARAILFLESGAQAAPAPTVPAMVGQQMRSGALPDGRDYSKLSRKERWEIDKREAGIESGS
jgi:hypothetical protein